MNKTTPPTAIPVIGPAPSFLEDESVGAAASIADGVGIARVGVLDATVAFCAKYTERSALSNPATGAVAVAPPEDLY